MIQLIFYYMYKHYVDIFLLNNKKIQIICRMSIDKISTLPRHSRHTDYSHINRDDTALS
jgi:hypothetical protein